ncbi:Conidiation-specific protein 10 [Pseudocercospora fuligena]|uniref:Conidiation-specific protein 10 n=1 Tax=Pseudocercospora fuligena TaxID=685502 RepID=A0A8H6RLB3_9PEZI|nr:Conidiation-specific protein 10 [Pseudocercospora fuligena]
MSTTNTNPGNFANRPTEEVKAIASMGGKASHKNDDDKKEDTPISHLPASETSARNDDGTFVKGSEAAKEAGHLGGLHAAGNKENESVSVSHLPASETAARNDDGTFTKGSEAAKEACHLGGVKAAEKKIMTEGQV